MYKKMYLILFRAITESLVENDIEKIKGGKKFVVAS
jgi:hypothetical protein